MKNKLKVVAVIAAGVIAGAVVATKVVKTIKSRKENTKKSTK